MRTKSHADNTGFSDGLRTTSYPYNLKSSDDALKEYSSFFHSIQEKSSVNSEQMAALINQWRELSDTDYDNSKSYTFHLSSPPSTTLAVTSQSCVMLYFLSRLRRT